MRNTKQRDLILDIINNSKNHLNAEQIYEICRQTIPNISLGTVYRNLNQLVFLNAIIRITTDEGIDRFDNTKIKHNHFICNYCHKIIDVFETMPINKKIIPHAVIFDYEVKYSGLCSKCLKEKEKNNYGFNR